MGKKMAKALVQTRTKTYIQSRKWQSAFLLKQALFKKLKNYFYLIYFKFKGI